MPALFRLPATIALPPSVPPDSTPSDPPCGVSVLSSANTAPLPIVIFPPAVRLEEPPSVPLPVTVISPGELIVEPFAKEVPAPTIIVPQAKLSRTPGVIVMVLPPEKKTPPTVVVPELENVTDPKALYIP